MPRASSKRRRTCLIAVTQVNYQLALPDCAAQSRVEIVIFPFSDLERHGIEDLRLVRFTDDDGSRVYYGTFSAYDGVRVFPSCSSTGAATDRHQPDHRRLRPEQGNGPLPSADPRKVRDDLADRQREPLLHGVGRHRRSGTRPELLQTPKYPWQVIQIGNCGSPIETEAGWLLLTHGVGPMRQYCIGATLLDLDDPCRSSARRASRCSCPSDDERSGYVPNVVYSCGAMVHNRKLIIPYAISDLSTRAVRIDLDELLESLES